MTGLIQKFLILNFLIPTLAFGALTEGTNCGFVTSAPTVDPEGSSLGPVDSEARAGKFTAPATGTVSQIGMYVNNATEEANFEVGLYSHDAVNNYPNLLLSGSGNFAKGTGAGWKNGTSLSMDITNATVYWIAVQVDNTATASNTDGATGGGRRSRDTSADITFISPWVSGGESENLIAIYALYTPTTAARRFFIFD